MEQDPNSLVPSSESGNNQDAQIHPKNNGSDNRGQHPAVRYIKVGLSLAFVEAAALFLEHFSDVFHGVFVELANWVSLCLQLLIVAVPISIWVEKRGKTKNWVWILYGLGCLAMLLAIFIPSKQPTNSAELKLTETGPSGWLPPELPSGCKDVVIWFGGQEMTCPLQTLTNYSWGPEMTSVPITKLPPNVRTNLPNLPGFSPRLREVLGVFSVTHAINGKNEDFYPVLPQVISNRLYVFVKIPFTNYQRIVMSDQMDSILTNCLPQSPAFWDWNYSHNQKTNAFEIVNENKNPIVQVIYKTPREVLVNGVFFVSHYDIQATFDGKYPGNFSIPNATTNVPADLFGVVLTNQFGGIFPTNPPKARKHQLPIYQVGFGATNLIWSILVEDVYGGFAANQKSIFKYPSNLFPGEFAE